MVFSFALSSDCVYQDLCAFPITVVMAAFFRAAFHIICYLRGLMALQLAPLARYTWSPPFGTKCPYCLVTIYLMARCNFRSILYTNCLRTTEAILATSILDKAKSSRDFRRVGITGSPCQALFISPCALELENDEYEGDVGGDV